MNLPHAVITRASASSKNHSELWHLCACHSRHKLRPILRNSAFLRVAAYHEAADVLEEDERNVALRAELDEMCAFQGGFGEQDAVVGENPHLVPMDAREPCVIGLAI